MCSSDIYFSTTYQISVYEIIYKTIGHTHSRIFTMEEKGEYTPTKEGIETEMNLSSNLSSIHPEISLDTKERFHPENH